jgi:hypothetical protein
VTTAGSGAAICSVASNDCSLRGAVLVANANPGSTINVPPGTYTLSIDGSSETGQCGDATKGDLDIAGNGTTITGAGSGSTIIQQTTSHDRVICVNQFLVPNFNFTMSGVTIEGGKETWGVGGGGMVSGNQGDSVTVSDVVFTNNYASKTSGGGSPIGGGVEHQGGSFSCTNCTFSNNTSVASGGGAYVSANYTSCVYPCAGTFTITSATFSGNTAGGNGGGLITTSGNSYSVTNSTFTNNTAQSASGGGGGLYDESGTLTANTNTFTGNQATGASASGNALSSADGGGTNMTANFNRIVSNSGSSSDVHAGSGSTASITNNWWGCDGGPGAAGCDIVGGSGTATFNPWIVLKTTASPSTVNYGDSTTLTTSFLQNSSGGTLTAGQVSVLISLPVTWTNAAHGTLSNQVTTIQSNGTATATFTAGSTSADCGNVGKAEAKVDNVQSGDTTATANTTINCPDLQASKTNNVSGQTQLGNTGSPAQTWTWTITGSNSGPGQARYSNGQTILSDNLPNSSSGYGTLVTENNVSGVTGTISCSINGTDDLTCTATGAVDINSSGSFTASFVTTPTAVATFNNPRASGACAIDPSNNIPETSDANNSCSNSVTVVAPDLTVANSNNVSGATTLGNNWTWKAHIANSSASATSTFISGQTIFTDDLDNSGHLAYITPAAGNGSNITNIGNVSCSITSNTLTCSATGTVVVGTSGSFDVTFTATPSATGTYDNPRSGGTCEVDSNNVVPETNEANNNCNTDSVTVTAPDLTIVKSNNVSGSVAQGNGWNWTLTITNSGDAGSVFTPGTALVQDDLDNSGGVTYGSPTVANITNVPNSGSILCAINGSDTLTCTANGTTVTVGAGTGQFDVVIPVTSINAGAFTNPRAAGICRADPNNSVVESNESNNDCNPNSVTVIAPPSITKNFGDSSIPVTGSTTLSFAITNPNASSSLTGVNFTDNLVTGLVVSTPNGLTGSCGGGSITAAAGTSLVSLAGAALSGGASCNFSVDVTGTTPGTKPNSVTVGSTNGGTGNTSTASVDVLSAPIVTNVSSTASNGTYGVGSSIPITVTFSSAVNVTGTPQLALNSGGTANYSSGTGTSTLTFTYTVASGENSADLDYSSTSALALNSGTIKDGSNNDAALTLPAPGAAGSLGANKNIAIDTTAPTVTNVSSTTANGTYGVGSVISVTVTFSKAVAVTGTPQLALNSGGTASYSSGTGTDTLTFTYTVASAENSAHLDYTSTSALTLNSGTIVDTVTNPNSAVLTLPAPGAAGSLSANTNIVIDTTSPTVTNVSATTTDGSYGVGSVISVTVTFNKVVVVTGAPQLVLNSGGTASYSSGTGTDTLTFTYTVASGESSADLDYSSNSALSLSGGTIVDTATNPNSAVLTLPAPGAAGSLGFNKNIVIDTTSPTVTNVSSTTANGSYGVGSVISVTVTFSQAVAVTGTPQLALNSGGTASYSSGSGTSTLTFTYTVASGESSADLDYNSTSALSLNSGTIFDTVSNPNSAVLTLPAPGAAGSLGANKDIVIDTTPPTTTIDLTPPNPDNNTTPTFHFSGDDGTGSGVASFQCKLDGGSYATCTSPFTVSPTLTDGSHTFYVYATDHAGNSDASPASYTWTVDATPPDTIIDTHPSNPTNITGASFTFHGDDGTGVGGLTYECKLDSGSFASCTSGQNYTGLSDGSHTFQVEAIDSLGNTDATPASFTWTVDTTAPDTTINSNPSNPTNNTSASFTFSGNDGSGSGVASFECQLDSGGFSACTSPQNYSSLTEGNHTFQVRAIDNVGLTDATPASFTWKIDLTPPDVTINQAAGQADPATGTVHFTAVFTEPVSGFAGSDVDLSASTTGGTLAAVVTQIAPMDGTTYDVAVSGMSATGTVIANIPAGSATDAAANWNNASTSTDNTVSWSSDLTPPDTTINSHPVNPTASTSASFTFTGFDSGSGVAGFQCKLDGGSYAACTSPQSYTGLSVAVHTFSVRAIDHVGNIDPTPATFTWEVKHNLIVNGGFNTYVGISKVPQYWFAQNFSTTDGKNTTPANVEEGPAAVQFGFNKPSLMKTLFQAIMLNGLKGDAFTFSFWVKGSAISTTNSCMAQVLFYKNNPLTGPGTPDILVGTQTVPCPTGTFAYMLKTVSFTVPAAYYKIVVQFTYSKTTGTVWFDNASLLK